MLPNLNHRPISSPLAPDKVVSVLGRLDRIRCGVADFAWKVLLGVAELEARPRGIGELSDETEEVSRITDEFVPV